MSDNIETPTSTDGTSNFQSYKEDAVGRVMDQIIKEKGEQAYDTNKEATTTNTTAGTNSTTSNEGASFTEFAETEINNPNFSQNQTHKGLDYNKITSELPDDAQKLLANMRSDAGTCKRT